MKHLQHLNVCYFPINEIVSLPTSITCREWKRISLLPLSWKSTQILCRNNANCIINDDGDVTPVDAVTDSVALFHLPAIPQIYQIL